MLYRFLSASDRSQELRLMSKQELQDHAKYFQIYGVVSESGFPTVVSGFKTGSVTVEQSGVDELAGQASGIIYTLPTNNISETKEISIQLEFNSKAGLENFQFKSHESRISGR
jgi:hypothetical protein